MDYRAWRYIHAGRGYWGLKKTDIFFPFEPVPKGRPRFRRTGKFIHSYTPPTTQRFESQIHDYYVDNCGDFYDGAIKVYLIFHMPIPVSISKKKKLLMVSNTTKHIKRPDGDNLAKSILDALNGIAYADDSQITILHIEKRYGEQVGISLKITEDVD